MVPGSCRRRSGIVRVGGGGATASALPAGHAARPVWGDVCDALDALTDKGTGFRGLGAAHRPEPIPGCSAPCACGVSRRSPER